MGQEMSGCLLQRKMAETMEMSIYTILLMKVKKDKEITGAIAVSFLISRLLFSYFSPGEGSIKLEMSVFFILGEGAIHSTCIFKTR